MTPSPSCECKIIEIRRSARFKDGLAKIEYCPTHVEAFNTADELKRVNAQAFALRDMLKRTRGVVDLIADLLSTSIKLIDIDN